MSIAEQPTVAAQRGVERTFLAIGDWSALVVALKRAGFAITLDREMRLAALLWRLTAAGVSLESAEDATDYLAPVLCVTADDRVRCKEIVQAHYQRRPAVGRPAPPRDPPVKDRTRLEIAFMALFAIAIVIVIGGIVWVMAPAPIRPPVLPISSAGDTPQADFSLGPIISDLLVRFFVAAPALFALAAILTWRREGRAVLLRKSAQAAREQTYGVPYDRSGFFRDRLSRNALFLLKRATRVTSERIDVKRSLKATLAACGWPVLHQMERRTNIELVMLVDRGRQRDHIGLLAEAIVDRLRAADAFITRYDYRLSPWRLTLVSGRPEGPPTQDLPRVAHRHTDHRLLLLTDGEGLFGRDTTAIDPRLLREFARFGQVILLTPTPPDFWGERERSLAAGGIIVAPATELGLDRAADVVMGDPEDVVRKIRRDIPEGFDPFLLRLNRDYHRLSLDKPPPREDIADLVVELQAWMGSRAGFKVLAAIAGFPWIEPGLTLAFGAAVLQQPVSPTLFTRLARLPWIRDARLPDWLRIAIINRLSEAERSDVVERVGQVIQLANQRAHGQPFSAEELAALPIAHDANAGNFFSNVDPIALSGLQERVFLSFLKGERLDPLNPLTPEATEAMKREVGADFVLRQKVLALLALVLSAMLFLFNSRLGDMLGQTERLVASITGSLLSDPRSVQICRAAALAACAAALVMWARSAAREPELATAQRSYRPDRWIPGLAALRERLARTAPFMQATRRDEWTLPTLAAIFLAVLALGSGDIAGRLVLLASLLTLGWVYWVRLPIAGAATSIHLDFESVEVCDSQNRCVTKPGDLAAYPLGRSIANGRWLVGTLAVPAIILPVFVAIGWGLALGFSGPGVNATAAGAAVVIVGFALTLATARRVIIGSWALPDRSFERSLTPLSDILFGTVLVTLFAAAFWLNAATLFGTSVVTPAFAFLLSVAGGLAALISIPLVGLRLRGGGKSLYVGLVVKAVVAAIAAEMAAFVIAIAANGVVSTVAGVCAAVISPLTLVGWSLFATFRSRRTLGLELERWRPIRRRAVWTAAILFVLFYLVWVVVVPVIVFVIVAVLAMGSLIDQLGIGLSGIDLSGFGSGATAVVAVIAAMTFTYFSLVYPLWRYVGPAVIAIEQLKMQGRLRPVAKTSAGRVAGAFWHTPWLALPCTAFFGVTIDWPWLGPLPGLAPFAIPVAVLFARRFGRAALVPILLGTLPLWIAMSNGGPVGTVGGAWPAVVTMFWVHFATDAQFRARLLQREWLSWRDIVLFGVLWSISIEAGGQMKNGGIIAFNVAPSAIAITLAIVVGASRMPRERVAVAIAATSILWFVVYAVRSQPESIGADFMLMLGLAPWTVVIAFLALAWIDPYRRALVEQPQDRLDPRPNYPPWLFNPRSAFIPTVVPAIFLAFAVGANDATGHGVQNTPQDPFLIAALGAYVGLSTVRPRGSKRSSVAFLAQTIFLTLFFAYLLSGSLSTFSTLVPWLPNPQSTGAMFNRNTLGVLAVFVGFLLLGYFLRVAPEGRADQIVDPAAGPEPEPPEPRQPQPDLAGSRQEQRETAADTGSRPAAARPSPSEPQSSSGPAQDTASDGTTRSGLEEKASRSTPRPPPGEAPESTPSGMAQTGFRTAAQRDSRAPEAASEAEPTIDPKPVSNADATENQGKKSRKGQPTKKRAKKQK